jgi:hypothetical protein
MSWFKIHQPDPEYQQKKEAAHQAIAKVQAKINILDIEYEGDFIWMDMKNITDEWTLFDANVPGMYVRRARIEAPPDVTPVECKGDIPVKMKKHRHHNWEALWMIEGEMIDRLTGEKITQGHSMTFKAKKWHAPEFTTPYRCVILWKPALPEG